MYVILKGVIIMESNRTKEEMHTIIENLDGSQLKVEKNAFDAINSSDTTLNLVKDGMGYIKTLSEKIIILNDVIQKTSGTMEQMEELANMIEGFAVVIAGISNKTNMLALNASIEAARAGEHGRGFAVVAKQVGELAAQSSKSSKEIKETIQSVQAFTSEMSTSLHELVDIVEQQKDVNGNAGEVFHKILDAATVANDVSRNMEHEIAYQREITDNAKAALDKLYNNFES